MPAFRPAMQSALGPPLAGPSLALEAGRRSMYLAGNQPVGMCALLAQMPSEVVVQKLAVFSLHKELTCRVLLIIQEPATACWQPVHLSP